MGNPSVDHLEKYWLDELGCSSRQLIPGKTAVVPHGTLSGYAGVYFFHRQDSCVVSAPSRLFDALHDKMDQIDAKISFSVEFIQSVLGNQLDRIIGPAWIGQISGENFRPVHGTESRMLSGSDGSGLSAFFADCPAEELAFSSLKVDSSPTVGVFFQGELVSAAGYEILGENIAHIGVITHPAYRGRGFSKKSISAITQVALEAKLGIQYQTLCSNLASVRAAQSIGFEEFAKTIAARVL